MNYCCICGKSFSSDWEDISVLLVKEMELPVCDECADILESLNGKEHGEAVKIIEKRLVENHCSDEICDAVMNLICNDEAEVKTDKKDAEDVDDLCGFIDYCFICYCHRIKIEKEGEME